MKLPPFSVHRPQSVQEASRLLAELGEDGAAYCGGTELLLAMKLNLTSYAHLIDLKRVPELHGIRQQDGLLRIGAAATHHELETSPQLRAWYPEMSAMAAQVANIRVRSVGTLGGNLCFADPHSDPATFLIAIGAAMVCQQGSETRRVPAQEFCTGAYETVLEEGELLVAVEIPARPDGMGLVHARMRLHERPVVTVAVMVQVSQGTVARARIVIGSVGAIPVAAAAAGQLVGGSRADFDALADACAQHAAQECRPLTGGDCSPEYLRHLVRVHSRRALQAAFSAAQAGRSGSGRPGSLRL